MQNVSGYIAAFHHATSRVVGITNDEMLDRFFARMKLEIRK